MLTGDGPAIYFPTFNVPSSGWLARHLLYWDQLLIPTPIETAERPTEAFDPFTRELMSRGLVSYVFPEDNMTLVWGISNAFAAAIVSEDLEVRLRSWEEGQVFGLHRGKTSHELLDHLADVGLASREATGEWKVERSTAIEYMSVVSIGLAREMNGRALTDSALVASIVATGTDTARSLLLDEALPAPEHFDLELLVRMRKKQDQWAKFRAETERYANLVALAQSVEDADTWRAQYSMRVTEAEVAMRKYARKSARVGRLATGPFGALVAGALGPVAGAIQAVSGFVPGAEPPEAAFAYSADRLRSASD